MRKKLSLVFAMAMIALLSGPFIKSGLDATHPDGSEAAGASDHPDEAIHYFLDKRLPTDETVLPTDRYVVANQEVQKMLLYSTATNTFSAPVTQGNLGTWEELGPGNIGGRTRALVIDPTTPNIMIAGGIAGGIWKTVDGGQYWTSKSQTFMSVISIDSLARGSDGALYAGTGDVAVANADIFTRGLGIYKSTDVGETWTVINGTENSSFYNINDIVVSPFDPRVIYAATDQGVWQGVKKLNKEKYIWTLVMPGFCYDLAMRTDTQNLTADCIFAAVPGAIYRTTDSSANGGTWSKVYPATGTDGGRISLAIAPNNQTCIYALISTGDSQLRAVIKSTNVGSLNSWQATVQGPFNAGNLNTALLSNAYKAICLGSTSNIHMGSYANVIAVDPVNSNRVWVGGIDLFRSDDGGVNWRLSGVWWTGPPHYIHEDKHALLFHPGYNGTTNTTMFIGTDGGIFKTDNALGSRAVDACSDLGFDGVNWSSLNHGYGVTQFYHGLAYSSGATYFGGTQDNGTSVGKDIDGKDQWSVALRGDGGFVATTTTGDVRYAEQQFGVMYKSQTGGAFIPTGNSGIDERTDASVPTLLPFVTTFVMDPNNSQRLWLGGYAMWRSDNAAVNWSRAHQTTRLEPGTYDPNKAITALAVAPGDSDIMVAGTRLGNIYRTSNANQSSPSSVAWTVGVPPRTDTSRVAWLAYDSGDSSHLTVYAAYSNFNTATTTGRKGHVFKSTNGGASFSNIDGSIAGAMIPDVPTHCIVVDPTNSLRLYAGTDVGVFVTVDGGTRWSRENTGFANAPTEAMSVADRNGALWLYAFTGGRGAWRVSLNESSCSPPIAPGNLTATAMSSSAIGLTWQDNSLNETGFRIERGTDGVNFTLVTTVAANQNTYTDNGRAASTTYYYRVQALGSSCGDSGYSNIAFATTLPVGSPPAPPSLLTATAFSSSRIDLAWHDNSNNEDNFHIDRKLGAGGTYADIATVAANSTSYPDTMNIQPNTTYFYRVRACSLTFGCSANSPEASATTPPGPPPPACVTVSLLSGNGTEGYFEGIGAGAEWDLPRSGVVAKDPVTGDQALFIADTNNHRIRLVFLDGPNAGASRWIAGDGVAGYKGGNKPADKVHYNSPMGIGASIDANGRVVALYIADTNNHMIRKLAPPTPTSNNLWVPSDVIGEPGVPGSNLTHLNFPQGVTVGADGNIYVADSDNNLIRKINSQNAMSNIITGATVGLTNPVGIMTTPSGLLYLCDPGNNSIWQSTTSGGTATRIAGASNGAAGFQDGVGTAARFNKPYHLVWCNTASGAAVFIADKQNHRLRKLTISTSSVTTVAGSTPGYMEGDCNTARFNSPRGVAAVSDGKVYVLDTGNQRIRKVQ